MIAKTGNPRFVYDLPPSHHDVFNVVMGKAEGIEPAETGHTQQLDRMMSELKESKGYTSDTASLLTS